MVDVQHAPERSRYEARLDGTLAGFAEYRDDGSVVTFHHTVVLPEFGGRGVASALVARALDETRAQGRGVRPLCSFVAGYIDKHPEYADLVAG